MTLPDGAPEPPARKRAPWSFRSLVEDVSGRPIADFQEPPSKRGSSPPRVAHHPTAADVPIPAAAVDAVDEERGAEDPDGPIDPVARIYPPLSGATARALHGAGAEHHEATLRSVEGPDERGRTRSRPPGPSRRPERIYLHYLLLHLDRLHNPALRYLQHAVDEEIAQRERPDPAPELRLATIAEVAPPVPVAIAPAAPSEDPVPPPIVPPPAA